MNQKVKEKLMRLAMSEADKAFREGNSPFGAVLADLEGNVIATAYNTTNNDIDPTAHAEINLIRKITKKLKAKDLSKYFLVSNAQSCTMCFSAAIKSKIVNFVFGTGNEANNNPNLSIFEIAKYVKEKLNIETGILKDECQKQIEEARKIIK
ncbi:MAG: hypothetical protein A2493_00080 [Candidatus Magasanikbacteria bacterium RIFOXYC12_FULL_33_11]|uniref:CMP/dCMP-type deaminase domain-containing protein n=1 Tax=Candidatus Magasanikbacteria bacterium RIFOXYC12_FULL_33_11 TaxID=1798701 RepID=A0A1F6NR41_9BACT|nr:MAG: hypothetical protein A2493_00080 [Candidatus Magasanikbacteria bacterium RIFOXYC12_FULL_33_11]